MTTLRAHPRGRLRGFLASLVRWFDSWAEDERDRARGPRDIDWLRVVPFVALGAWTLWRA